MVKIQVEVFWDVMCSVMVGHSFRGPCCFHPTASLHSVTTQMTLIKLYECWSTSCKVECEQRV